ncbi:A24 family peptidase [Gilvimarinus sp. SDUM040013]|uniref:Prepilin leader peptidase/N-methyltransferase n=1 Tax=Gilvimarinus gilvus TaxID=3058038 RepID=A0ABU4RW89_9GAMM|nr:A24 family peptidase [Gilvimarinus sp. SDUM040013]MDO3388378.1 A24 family peptidase [Gilvimarinus sp. SDUM040013]MDX6847928.1 A24 family peptidase [Gilvimarinus sp. SDUM040013]
MQSENLLMSGELVWFAYAIVIVFSLVLGSFFNVVILRLPKQLQQQWTQDCCELLEQPAPTQEPFGLAFPNSHCPKCEAPIKPWHNIPVVSYLMLKGKCASCKASISLRYPVIEIATALLSVVVVNQLGFNWLSAAVLVFTWALINLTVIDFDTQLLPDSITLPLLWLGLIVNYYGLITDLPSAFWGAIFGYLSLWSVFWLFKLLTGKEGMGYGDFKLLAALGAWMGWQMLPLVIILSSLVGAAIGITLIVTKGRDKNIPIPFGPYLAIAGWIAMLWGSIITESYLQLAYVG